MPMKSYVPKSWAKETSFNQFVEVQGDHDESYFPIALQTA